ncbi:MAG: hypothetical protein ACRDJC_05350 [Thermomicrobiales bacterium]
MKHRINAAVTGAVVGLAGAADAAAQFRLRDRFFGDDDDVDIAVAGSGGVATASASGGAVGIGDINSGGNVCNAIGIGDTFGITYPVDPIVYGGDCFNTTALDVSASGGTAMANASGGNYNIAFVS